MVEKLNEPETNNMLSAFSGDIVALRNTNFDTVKPFTITFFGRNKSIKITETDVDECRKESKELLKIIDGAAASSREALAKLIVPKFMRNYLWELFMTRTNSEITGTENYKVVI